MAGEGCLELKKQISKSITTGYAYLATAVSDRGIVVMFFINKTGQWHIIGVDDDLNACVVAQGTDWVFAMQQGI